MKAREIEVFNKYINPFYGLMMAGNILRSPEKKDDFINSFRKILAEADSELIRELLEINNWRSRVVAAYLIGLKKETIFINQIGNLLINGCGGVTGYFYAFAEIGTEECIYWIKEYLNKFLDAELPNVRLIAWEHFQDWGIVCLQWLDNQNNTNHALEYLAKGGLYEKFIDYRIGPNHTLGSGENSKWRNLKPLNNHFAELMEFYKMNF